MSEPDFALDVVLRTHNRADMIEEALQSVLAADADGIALRVLVVDNASTDDTPSLLARLAAEHSGVVVALHEAEPGGQHALNAALALCTAPVVAFFDDDERVDARWLQVIRREFADAATDFIAGPYVPLWREAPPAWMPEGYGGVLGIIDNGPARRRFGPGFAGMLTQGNCAVRRAIFGEAGPYPDALVTAEDRWLHEWLMRHGKVGYYCPDLVVSHVMQSDRLTRTYFRQWAAREGRDRAVCDRIAGVRASPSKPWFWRRMAGNAMRFTGRTLTGRGSDAAAFAAELDLRQSWAQLRASYPGR